jgi:hypothetical protein
MDVILAIIVIVFGILQIILFFKIWGMTNDVNELQILQNGMANDVEKLKIKICNRGLTNAQLSKRMLELKYTGRKDEAKTLVDQNLMLDVFNIICSNEISLEQSKEKAGKVILWYEKYYKILGCEVPTEFKEINIEKVAEEYRLTQKL